jgi:hypothetical protein
MERRFVRRRLSEIRQRWKGNFNLYWWRWKGDLPPAVQVKSGGGGKELSIFYWRRWKGDLPPAV